jgi:hypothetical protein
MMNLTEKEAFAAMFYYLDSYYDRTKSDEIGSILGDLTLLADGMPADPAAWEDWNDAVKKAISKLRN